MNEPLEKSPLLIIDQKKILEKYHSLTSAFPDFKVAYAIKANSDERILQNLHAHNSWFEVASLFEIRKLLALGVAPQQIVFSNPIKPISYIEQSIASGVNLMSFDSIEELEKFIPFKDKAQLLLRIEVSNEGSLWPLTKKFGAAFSQLDAIFDFARKNEIPLEGFTFHSGSQNESLQNWRLAFADLRKVLQKAKNAGISYKTLNIGGGFPINLGRKVPTAAEMAAVIHDELAKLKAEGFEFSRLIMEPGRYIVGEAGTLVTKIIGIANRVNQKWVYLDVGVFSGLMETIDGITYPTYSNSKNKEEEEVFLCGPSCDSVDKMFKTKIPSPVYGDILYFTGCGAYTTVYASEFNGFMEPQIAIIEGEVDPVSFYIDWQKN